MSKKYRSAKGEIVDIDLLRLKQSLAGKPIVASVQAREKFVDGKLQHRRKKIPPLPRDLLENINKPKQTNNKDDTKPKVVEEQVTTKKTKQRARPKVEKTEEQTNE